MCDFDGIYDNDVDIETDSSDIDVIDTDINIDLSSDNELAERTIFELENMADALDLSECDDTDVEQIAGAYKDIKGSEINGEIGEAHHIIPQSTVEFDKKEGICIELEKEDHRTLPTTGGRMNRKFESFLPDSITEDKSLKDTIIDDLSSGNYAEEMKYNILDIKRQEYDKAVEEYKDAHYGMEPDLDDIDFSKYDKAIRQSIEKTVDYIREFGVPKGKK